LCRGSRSRRRDRSWKRSGRRRRSWPCDRRRNHRPRNHRGRGGTRRSHHGFLLLGNGFQHISGTGDVRQIDLGLDFFFAAQRTCGAGRRRLRLGRATDVLTHLFRFMFLERTGMGLLLRHSDER
jgi:hypothetical protein